MSLAESFTLSFRRPILPGLVVIGKYDGVHPCLTCGTTAGKVFIHNPHESQSVPGDSLTGNGSSAPVTILNINRDMTALAVGKLGALEHDALFVGTATSLQAYDVHANADIFYKEVPGGVRVVAVGALPHHLQSQPDKELPGQVHSRDEGSSDDALNASQGSRDPPALAVVGGDCSLVGFDEHGTEAFWTVCGDNVGAMALLTNNNGGSKSSSSSSSSSKGTSSLPWADMAVGCDDFALRFFKGEELFAETFEADRFVALAQLKTGSSSARGNSTRNRSSSSGSGDGVVNTSFVEGNSKKAHSKAGAPGVRVAYGLRNGTVGVYEGGKRVWRVKSKHRCVAVVGFDLKGNGVEEVASGWSNGAVNVRQAADGVMLFKVPLVDATAPVAGLSVCDYKFDSMNPGLQLVVAHTDGEVRGYSAVPLSAAAAAAAAARSAATAANSLQEPANQGSSSSGGGSSAVGVPAGASTEEVAESLQREKAALLEELHAVSLAQQRQAAAPRRGASSDATSVYATSIDQLQLLAEVVFDDSEGLQVQLSFSSNAPPGLNIVQAVLWDLEAGGLFLTDPDNSTDDANDDNNNNNNNDGGGPAINFSESFFAAPADPKPTLIIPLRPTRNAATSVSVQAMVGTRVDPVHLAVLSASFQLPKFSTLVLQDTGFDFPPHFPPPEGVVTFRLKPGPDPNNETSSGNSSPGRRGTSSSSSSSSSYLSSGLEEIVQWCNQTFVISTRGSSNSGDSTGEKHMIGVQEALHAHRESIPVQPGNGGSPRFRVIFAPVAASRSTNSHGSKNGGRNQIGPSHPGALWIDAKYDDNHSESDPSAFGGGSSNRGGGSAGSAGSNQSNGNGSGRGGSWMVVSVRCESLELAAACVSDLASCLRVAEMEAVADFPHEMEALRETLGQVAEYNRLRQRLAVDSADGANRVKALIVRAEDARQLGNMSAVQEHYSSLERLNAEMAMEYTKRANNHAALLAALREVNVAIERASRLRVGQPRTNMVAAARSAVKTNNADQLVGVLCNGSSSQVKLAR